MRLLLTIYEMIWFIFASFLIFFPKIRGSWKQRLWIKEKGPFDLWIHGASVGEAYILLELISHLREFKIIATTNTAQGKSILEKEPYKNVVSRYLPFDFPSIMKKAISKWKPKLVVILETELWPGLLYACKSKNVPVILINARLSSKSFKRYKLFRGILKRLSPDLIYAISEDDAIRYKEIFGKALVRTMNNIKFDRIKTGKDIKNPLQDLIPKEKKFIVFGSIRKEEEQDILYVVQLLVNLLPDTIIGLFPRHLERVKWWKESLDKRGIKYKLRSEIRYTKRLGHVILWDKIGELENAYSIADSVFVGGSLRPLGGHNFLEPLSYGIIPHVGPFIENFSWVGEELFKKGLLIKVRDKKDLAERLIYQCISPVDKEKVRERFEAFLLNKRGGVKTALKIILEYLKEKDKDERSICLSTL